MKRTATWAEQYRNHTNEQTHTEVVSQTTANGSHQLSLCMPNLHTQTLSTYPISR